MNQIPPVAHQDLSEIEEHSQLLVGDESAGAEDRGVDGVLFCALCQRL